MQWLPLLPTRALALAAFVPLVMAAAPPASAQESDDGRFGRGQISRDEVRDFLREALEARRESGDSMGERIQERRDRRADIMDMMEERRDRRRAIYDRLDPEAQERIRDALRERVRDRVGERLRERIRDRIAERRGEDEGRCFIVTRMLRAEDGDVTAIVRRRICRE